jgi:hypothetical protein
MFDKVLTFDHRFIFASGLVQQAKDAVNHALGSSKQ